MGPFGLGHKSNEPVYRDITVNTTHVTKMGLNDIIGVLQGWRGANATFDQQFNIGGAIDYLARLLPDAPEE